MALFFRASSTTEKYNSTNTNLRQALRFTGLVAVMALTACNETATSNTQNTETSNQSTPAIVHTLENNTAVLATGGASGPYNTIGETLVRVYNDNFNSALTTQTTGASVENLALIGRGDAQLAFAMSDVVNEAILGQDHFSAPIDNIAQIATLYPNYVQVVTSRTSGIQDFNDLQGKRVAVGAKNSGVEVNARKLLAGFGLDYDDIEPSFLGYNEAATALEAGELDAAFLTSGLPNHSLESLSQRFDLKLVSIDAETINNIATDQPYFVSRYVPAGMYGDKNAIPTAAIMNALVVDANMSDDDVYVLTKTLFENVDRLRHAHPAAATITAQTAQENTVASIHPGAQRYYDEVAN